MNYKIVIKENIIYLTIAILSFIYVLIRAIYIPAYHDEINTFFWYVQTGAFQPFYSFADQNNHVLNSLFAHLIFLAFGDSIIALRLANVLSYLIYLFFVWKIAKTFQSKSLAFTWFIAMTSSIYFISFFSLCRGYGLSMAFLLASIYYLSDNYSNYSHKSLLLGLFFSVLALWSYLGLMVPVLLVGFVFIFLFFRKVYISGKYKQMLLIVPAIIILFIIPLFYAIRFSFYMKTHCNLYGSSEENFFQAVILDVIDAFSGPENSLIGRVTAAIMALTWIVSTIISFGKNYLKTKAFLLNLIFLGTIAGTVVMHYLLGVKYPVSRMSLQFFMLFMLAVFYSVNNCRTIFIKYPAYLISIILFIQLILTFNVSYAPCWREDTLPKSICKKISAEKEKSGILPTISTYQILDKELQYYDYIYGGKLNSAQVNYFPSKIADFIIGNHYVNTNIFKQYDTIDYSKETKVFLLKRKNPVQWMEVKDFTIDYIESENEFIRIIPEQLSEPFIGYPFCYDIEFTVQSERFPLRLVLTCDVWDSTQKSLSMNATELQCINSDARHGAHFHRRQYIENISQCASLIKFYFLNIKMEEMKISDIHLKLYRGINKFEDIVQE